jgi:wobble nucleotide-excising tRNase
MLERLDQGGYQLKRNGVVARNLSEGEKTAISLIYFFSKIQENDTDLQNLIIVVDDPVSSFDSNHLFNASAYIKNVFEKAQQIFVLTHNFWFFKQVRDWMHKKNDNERKKQRPEVSNMYFVDRGNLKNATPPLMKFHSEYQHVFHTVLNYHQSEACDDATCFAIANAGRRLLEGFNSFKTPDNSGFNSIFDLAKKKGLDNAKRDRVFYFLNKYSHLDRIESFDSAVETLLEEGKNVATDILWMIKKIDCDHYESMLRVCGLEDDLV